MPMFQCGECTRTFTSPHGRQCPTCGNYGVLKVESVISTFIRNNYRTFDEVVVSPVVSKGQAENRLCIRCKDCKTVVHIKTIDTLNISVETYTMAIIRRGLEKHMAECDGTYKPPVRELPKPGVSDLRSRKIELD